MFAELLGDGAHLVGHSYGAVIALLAAAQRPEAVRSLTVSEPGALRLAEGHPAVDEMIAGGEQLYSDPGSLPADVFLRLFRSGAGSAHETPVQLSGWLAHGAELLRWERPPWEADIPLHRLASAGFPVLVVSGDHSPAFEAVCDALAEAHALGAGGDPRPRPHDPLCGPAVQRAAGGVHGGRGGELAEGGADNPTRRPLIARATVLQRGG
jgi:pimeloyl-ACP methyl ester carboxylesterase